jgi:hypothetical protein
LSGFREGDLTVYYGHQQCAVFLYPSKWDTPSISLQVWVGILFKPLLKEFLQLTAMRVAEIDLSQVLRMVKEQMPDLHVVGELLLPSVLVILVLVAASGHRRLDFVV